MHRIFLRCFYYKHSFVVNSAGGKIYQHKNEGYLHGAGEELLPQRWFSLGQEVEIHPSQSRCHSGSMGGSGPVTHKTNKWVLGFLALVY